MKIFKQPFLMSLFFLIAAIFLTLETTHASTKGNLFPIATTAGSEIGMSGAFDGTNYLLGIQGDATANNHITAQLISTTGAPVGSRISIMRTDAGRTATGGAPNVAFDGTNYLVIWADDHYSDGNYHPDGYDVQFGQLINQSGEQVSSSFFLGASLADAYSFYNSGAVIFDGNNYFVVWERRRLSENSDNADIYGQFITPSGALLGPAIAISTAIHGQRDPALAFDGTNIMVVWTDSRNHRACYPDESGKCYESDIYGQLVAKSSMSSAGSLNGSNFLINAGSLPRDGSSPAIAFDGTNYFIAFAEETTFPDLAPGGVETWHVFGQRVNTSGTALGGTISIKTDGNIMFPGISFDGTKYLVTWNDRTNWDFYGQLVNISGALISSDFAIDNDSGNQLGSCSRTAVNGKLLCLINTGFDFSIDSWGDVYGLFLETSSALYGSFTGNGIWQWNGSGWTQLTPDNPEEMVASGTNLYGDFGTNGLWQWNGSGWSLLTPDNPEAMVASGTDLYGDFGSNGLWQWNGSGWSLLTPDNPEAMVTSGSNLYGDFGANGLWQWNGSGWSLLTPDNPEAMVASGTNLYGTFTGNGVWQWNGSGWIQLTPDNPSIIVADGTNLYGSFTGNGVWQWNGSGWSQLTPDNPASMVTGN